MSGGDNCTDLLVAGKLGGAGAGEGSRGPMFHLLGSGGLGWTVTPPSSHIHRNPLCDQGLGTVGPLRGCDTAASHLTGCTLVPMD